MIDTITSGPSAYGVGDVIRFRRSDGTVQRDVVRGHFIAETLLEPYARNESAPALVLTQHSWCFERDVIAMSPSDTRIADLMDTINQAADPVDRAKALDELCAILKDETRG